MTAMASGASKQKSRLLLLLLSCSISAVRILGGGPLGPVSISCALMGYDLPLDFGTVPDGDMLASAMSSGTFCFSGVGLRPCLGLSITPVLVCAVLYSQDPDQTEVENRSGWRPLTRQTH